MKNIFAALAITALTATLAVAQTSTDTGAGAGAGAGAGVAGGNTGTTATTGANGSADTTGATTTDPSTTGNAGTTNKTVSSRRADAKKMNLDDCTAMMRSAHAGSDTTFSDAEAQPYIGRMSSLNMSTKSNGKLTTDEFLTACQEGAFEANQ